MSTSMEQRILALERAAHARRLERAGCDLVRQKHPTAVAALIEGCDPRVDWVRLDRLLKHLRRVGPKWQEVIVAATGLRDLRRRVRDLGPCERRVLATAIRATTQRVGTAADGSRHDGR